ncbi:MAG: hypothetical protein IJ458_04215 [Clostridia bacterium]|nr:hypothetical protein [Clostridia bacterium]
MFCKTIILSNSENLTSNAPKGILTLSKENSMVKGKIRLYNLSYLPQSTKIGLYINESVHIYPIVKKNNYYEFDINNNIDISQSIYCALIDTSNNKKVLLEGGSFNGFYFTDSPFDAVLEAKDEQLEQNIDNALKEIEPCEKCNCSDCEYKKFFYDNHSQSNNSNLNSSNKNNISQHNCDIENTYFNSTLENNVPQFEVVDSIQSNIIDKLNNELIDDINNHNFNFDKCESDVITNNLVNDTLRTNKERHVKDEISKLNNSKNNEKLEFLNDIIYQLDEMFERYPNDEVLTNIIPNSRFISVDGDNPYVLGVIYEDDMLKYIAYGVPAQYNSLPPKDFGRHYQWLPLNPRDVMSDGYFMIYQDALNGNIVEIDFEE